MGQTGRTAATRAGLGALLTTLMVGFGGCAAREPVLAFLDDESSLSFTHPPKWSVGLGEQGGVRYRYLTAPKVESEPEALSVTFISPVGAESVAALAEPYLSGGSGATSAPGREGSMEWAFKDSSGVSSRLRVLPTDDGRFFGAWVRGPDSAFRLYADRVDALLASVRVENEAHWSEEAFAGLAARVPKTWTRGSRLSNKTRATMQFKSPPLAVEKGTATIHGFITISKEPVPPPGDLAAFASALKERSTDTVVLLQHALWPGSEPEGRPSGFVDYMRSGTTLTSTRIRRWITVKAGVGLIFSCEARADAFDRLDPWCRRLAHTIRLE